MSRSFKKNPIVRDNNPGMKKILRRKLRRSLLDNDNLPQNGEYRKMTERWDFMDFSFEQTLQEALDMGCNYEWWYRTYKMK